MAFYLETKEKKDCYSCNACASICPNNCIKMVNDENTGYYFPKVNKTNCTNCGKCKRGCINNNSKQLKEKIKKSYIIFRENEEKRKTSASGGVSALLMEYIINQKGIVYGVELNKELTVVHTRATTLEECNKYKTSKYVKSNNVNIYKDILKDLKNDKLVLFTGVPCEVASIKRTIPLELQKKLVLCEIMCDCTLSPLLFNKFKKEIETKYNSKISNINFRSKAIENSNRTMEINFKNGKKILLPSNKKNLYVKYLDLFGTGLSSLYSCQYCDFEDIDKRVADLTLGDYNGKINFFKNIQDKSILLISSNKGEEIFDNAIKEKSKYIEVSVREALEKNHVKPKRYILNKYKFMEDLNKYDFNELSKKYVEKYRYRKIIAKLIPSKIKDYIKERLCSYDR